MTLGLFGALGLLDSGLFSNGLFGGFWGALVLLRSEWASEPPWNWQPSSPGMSR